MRLLSASGHDRRLRKRKFHRKSRHGCGNCKLRRVKASDYLKISGNPRDTIISLTIHKCDETRPECNNCRSYQVLCSYRSETVGLHMPKEVVTPVQAISTDDVGWLDLDSESATSLTRFGARTAATILDVDQDGLLERAFLVSLPRAPRPLSTLPIACP